MKRLLHCLAAVAAVLVAMPTAGSASVPTTPFTISLQHPGVAEAISCASPIACVSVGEVVGTHGEVPTAVRWNLAGATSFPGAPAHSPYGAQQLGISCTGPLNCVAVGDVQTKYGYATPRVDVLTPTGWTSTLVNPAHRGADNLLTSVSCPSPTQCYAVGSIATGIVSQQTHSVVESITVGPNGQVVVTAMLHPTPGTIDSFNAISCSALSSCVAVGTTFGGAGHTWAPLVEQMVAGVWNVATAPGVRAGYLLGVSCVATSSCVAVGSTNGLSVASTRPVVATEANGTWSSTTLNLPGGSLIGVSCVAPLLCRAVGSTTVGTATTALALTNRSGPWHPFVIVDTVHATRAGQWSAIACPLENQCHLTGTTAVSGVPSIMAATPNGPAVTALSSSTGPIAGGQRLVLRGLHFTRSMVVTVGAARARVLAIRSSTSATVLTPTASVTAIGTSVLVRVATAAGVSPDIAAAHYTYA